MTGRQKYPWIWRTCPDWYDILIGYIMFEAKILANSPNTISGKISGIRFLHFLVAMPDFTLGGGRYTQVLKILRRGSKVNRKAPFTLEMLTSIAALQQLDDPKSVGIASAALVGFFFLLRVGKLESLRRMDASLSTDSDGDV